MTEDTTPKNPQIKKVSKEIIDGVLLTHENQMRLQKEYERKRHGPFHVRDCRCGGKIMFKSWEELAPGEQWRMGGKSLTVDKSECYCDACGTLYKSDTEAVLQRVEEYRKALLSTTATQ